jgi:plasmid replication initiation protein
VTVAQPDLFLAAISDAPFRDGLDLMSVPIVSLAKGRRVEPIVFRRGDVSVEVSAPPHIGIATIWDLDVLLWAISQLNDAVDRGETPPPTIHAHAYDILKAVKRGTGGREYLGLREALDRLVATTIRTTIRSTSKRGETFGLLERVGWVEDETGRLKHVSLTVPHWLHSAVMDRRVLALDPRYFEMTSGMGRWLYRVARKKAGDREDGWRWTLAELHARSGVTRPLRSFASDLRKLVKANTLPEYWLTTYTDTTGAECLHIARRSKLASDHPGREAKLPRSRRNPTL